MNTTDDFQFMLCDIQGRLFELSAPYASESFIRSFMNSEVAEHLDTPYSSLQCMGEEYLLDALADEKQLRTEGERYSREVLYWTGYLYRYWAITRSEKSRRIYRLAPAKSMKQNYLAFHTMDPELAIEDLIEIHRQKQSASRGKT